MAKKALVASAFLYAVSISLCAQSDDDTFKYFSSPSGIQYGFAIKASLTFHTLEHDLGHFRLGVSGGIGAFTGHNWFYPSLNGDLMIFHSGLGSNWPGIIRKNFFDVHAIISYTITTGCQSRLTNTSDLRPGERNYPLYYFNNWSTPALQNPYKYSVSWGGNIIFLLSGKQTWQMVGFLNVHADRFQLSYYNDGPPFSPPFGDKFDRYYTGGAFVSYHCDNGTLMEFGFNKFTGYNPSTYEISNRIGGSYVLYRNPAENFFNKSNWHFTIVNTVDHFGATFNLFNYSRLDTQHRIHTKSFYPLHVVPYKGSWSVGPVYYYSSTHIGLQ